jgi:hypothetical protein
VAAEPSKAPDAQTTPSQESVGSRSSRKRKRASDVVHSSRKRKQQSPLKAISGFFRSWVISQPQEDDGDIEDEIVVASSQIAISPQPAEERQNAPSPVVVVPVGSADLFGSIRVPATSVEQTATRKRGRARKSQTPTPAPIQSQSQSQAREERLLKRKASVLETLAASETREASVVRETEREPREGPDTQLVKAARLSQSETNAGRLTERRSQVNSATPDVAADLTDGLGQNEMDMVQEAVRATKERVKATPKSILGRLRDVLVDLPSMILGSQEERELDDMLFDVRRAMHEAARRGREADQ